jgi:hypothetical protein
MVFNATLNDISVIMWQSVLLVKETGLPTEIYKHIKEISKKKNKTDFSQHSCTTVFTAVADLQVQCL